jgi:hypothetical protein
MQRDALSLSLSVLCLWGCASEPQGPEFADPCVLDVGIPLPEQYVCYRAPEPLAIDGKLDEAAWAAAKWTAEFRDIQGLERLEPRHATRAKMLWDDTYLYVGAWMDEPHLWATLSKRDSIIYYDNDFEVFIDPDGDTHQYYELEINALGTEWDLFLCKPYRDGGPALHDYDMLGLRTAVALQGTLNDPSDEDKGWSVEIAIPWSTLKEAAHRPSPPKGGDMWRINFSRVQWQLDVVDGKYRKRKNPKTGQNMPEDNWVWSPQWIINMHEPEHWGYVQFSDHNVGEGEDAPRDLVEEPARQALRAIYDAQITARKERRRFVDELDELGLDEGLRQSLRALGLQMRANERQFFAQVALESGQVLSVDHEGRVLRVKPEVGQ